MKQSSQQITTPNYWGQRYQQANTPWDMGQVSPPLTAFLQNWQNRQSRILIPGAGRAHEAAWLWENGYDQVWVAEVAEEPLQALEQRVPGFPAERLLHQDFFDLRGQYDLILEQTFFCALPPDWRPRYAQKMAELLPRGGHLAGVLFSFPLSEDGPPFGGSREEYLQYFHPYFKIFRMENCYNSIAPRLGSELFFHLIRL